jgi:predicted DNA-binding transcriptional regulator AlpA
MMNEENEDVISGVNNAAKYLNLSRRTVHRLIKKGTFPTPNFVTPFDCGLKENRQWRTSDLEAFVQSKKQHNGKRKKPKSHETDLIKALESSYRDLKSLRFSGQVGLDELFLRLQAAFPEITHAKFQEVLQKLWNNLAIELHLINFPSSEEVALNNFCLKWKET